MKSEKPNDLSARLGQPSSRQADEHNGLGRIGVPMVGGRESVWCQPSSGSETTCERPNQKAQWCVVPMLGVAVQVRGSFVCPQASPSRAQCGPGLEAESSSLGLALTIN